MEFSYRYTRSHQQMLLALSRNDLQRLYRLLTEKSEHHSLWVSYLYRFKSLTSADHREINRHNRQRATCDTQRWAIEEVLKFKRFQERKQQDYIDSILPLKRASESRRD